jgi:hypothetical protein
MRLSDYAVWAGVTGAFPAALYCWGMFPTQIIVLSADKPIRNGRPHKTQNQNIPKVGWILGFHGWIPHRVPEVFMCVFLTIYCH